jgi:hypothetical protein
MAKKDFDGHGVNVEHSGKTQLHVTAGGILTPVLGFRGAGVTGTPPKPVTARCPVASVKLAATTR